VNGQGLQRSKFIKVLETGETLARMSVADDGNIIIHFWSKVRKAEVSIPFTELMRLAFSNCHQEQGESDQQSVLIRGRFTGA